MLTTYCNHTLLNVLNTYFSVLLFYFDNHKTYENAVIVLIFEESDAYNHYAIFVVIATACLISFQPASVP